MKDAEQLFAKEVQITWLHATKPRTFQEWLCAARRSPTRLAHVPANAADDAVLAAQMCAKEHFLLRLVPRRHRLDLFLCLVPCDFQGRFLRSHEGTKAYNDAKHLVDLRLNLR